MVGSSHGGLLSCYAGWTKPDIFERVGCMSSSFWWMDEEFNKDILTSNGGSDKLHIYLDAGSGATTEEAKNHITLLK